MKNEKILKRSFIIKGITDAFSKLKLNFENLSRECENTSCELEINNKKSKLECYTTCQAGFVGILIECKSQLKSIEDYIKVIEKRLLDLQNERRFNNLFDKIYDEFCSYRSSYNNMSKLYKRLKEYEQKEVVSLVEERE